MIRLALAAGLLLAAHPARAGVDTFLSGCMAAATDLRRLPGVLKAAGMAELDPAQGPHGPDVAIGGRRRLLFSLPVPSPGDSYTGYVAPEPGLPVETCWHASRPTETARESLDRLRRRFPPVPGSVEDGTETFYGGRQQWQTRLDDQTVIVGVSWPAKKMLDWPGSLQYVIKVAAVTGDAVPAEPGRTRSLASAR